MRMKQLLNIVKRLSGWEPLTNVASRWTGGTDMAWLRCGGRIAESVLWLWIKREYSRGVASAVLGYSKIMQLLGRPADAMAVTSEGVDEKRTVDARDDILHAQAVRWTLENSTEEEEILVCVDNIPTISSLRSTQIIARGPCFSALVQRFEAALVAVLKGDTQQTYVAAALALGKAIAHAIVADPIHCGELLVPALNPSQIVRLEGRDDTRDLQILCMAFWCLKYSKEPRYLTGRGLIYATADALPFVQQSTLLILFNIRKLSPFEGCFGLIDLDTVHGNALLSLLYLEITDIATGSQRPVGQRVQDVWQARSGTTLLENLASSLRAHDRQISTGRDRQRLLEWHTELLRDHRLSNSASVRDIVTPATLRPLLVQHLANVLQHCESPSSSYIAFWMNNLYWANRVEGWMDYIDGWDSRLLDDPPIELKRLQTELEAYATQLLLCLGAPSLKDSHSFYSQTEVHAVVSGIVKFQDRMMTDDDVTLTLHISDGVLKDRAYGLLNSELYNSTVFSISPIVTRALH